MEVEIEEHTLKGMKEQISTDCFLEFSPSAMAVTGENTVQEIIFNEKEIERGLTKKERIIADCF